jgi:tetratricopeptide (TPR) repeat protein
VQASRGVLQNPELLDIKLRNDAAELGGNLVVISQRTTLSVKGEVHLCDHAEQAQPAPDAPAPRGPTLMQASNGAVQDASLDGRARELFVLGRDAYLQERYEDALRYFKAAHSLSGRYELQYNIGQAADRLHRRSEALGAFDAYLEQAPASELRNETEARAEVLRGEVVPRAPH